MNFKNKKSAFADKIVFTCSFSKDKRKKRARKWLDGKIETNFDGTIVTLIDEKEWKAESYRNIKKPIFIAEGESIELNYHLVDVDQFLSGKVRETSKKIESPEKEKKEFDGYYYEEGEEESGEEK